MELHEALFQHGADGVLITRLDGRILRANPAACRLLGFTERALQGMGQAGLFLDEPGGWRPPEARRGDGASRGEARLRRADGGSLPVELTSAVVRSGEGPDCAYISFRDVTERRAAEAALRASEERFRQLAESAADVFWLLDVPEGRVAYVSPAYEVVWGQTCQSRYENPGAWAEAIHPEDRPRVLAAFAARQSGSTYDEEYRLVRPDGSLRWIRDRAAPVRDAEGRLVRLAGIAEDITARKLAEETQRHTRRALQTLGRCSDALVRAGSEQVLLDAICRAVVEQGGYRMCWVGLVEHDLRRTIRPVAQAGHEDGYLASLDVVWADTARGRGPSGTAVRTRRPVVGLDFLTDLALAPWRAEALGRGYRSAAALPLLGEGTCLGVLSVYSAEVGDFTEDELRLLLRLADDLAFGVVAHRARADRDRLTAQLVQADRLVAMGTLAAGVAHEINNPLAYVVSALAHLAETMATAAPRLPAGAMGDAREVLAEAQEGAERIRLIVRDLKTFSRAEDARVERLDLAQVIDASVSMAMSEIKHRSRVVKAYGATPPVRANAARLGQVFLNLLVNAAQAIPPGHAQANEIRITTSTDAGGRARVEVRDSGAGVSTALAGRIFEPFVTSKPQGEGTGLGLSICRSVVAALGGEIGFESLPGQGTVFRVTLPAAGPEATPVAPDAAPRADAPAPADGRARRRGRVAVVDDEPAIRRAVARALGPEHEVSQFENARALASRLAEGQRFDVILSDLMMPDLTGMDLHRLALDRWPDQAGAMIFMTGGAFTPEAAGFLASVPNPAVEKPFDLAGLRVLVRSRVA